MTTTWAGGGSQLRLGHVDLSLVAICLSIQLRRKGGTQPEAEPQSRPRALRWLWLGVDRGAGVERSSQKLMFGCCNLDETSLWKIFAVHVLAQLVLAGVGSRLPVRGRCRGRLV